MNILADKNKAVISQTVPFAAILLIVLSKTRGVIDFFTLTEADRLNAGIFMSSNGRDESNP